MEFRQLEYIMAVAKYRNVTKAAESLYISQSALSHYIKNAEDELGVRLFDRSTNPISLTKAGECYMESARRILIENERLTNELRDLTNHMSGKLTIGTSNDRCSYMIPKLLPAFCAKYPNISINVVIGGGQVLSEKLKTGEIDIMILPTSYQDRDPAFVYEKMYTEEVLFAARKGVVDEKDINGRSINPKAIEKYPLFIQNQGHINRDCVDRFFRTHRIRPVIKQEFNSNISCFRMAATGAGATIVPFMTTQLAYPGQPVDLFSIGTTWDVSIIYRKDYYLGIPEQELIKIGRDIFSKELISPEH